MPPAGPFLEFPAFDHSLFFRPLADRMDTLSLSNVGAERSPEAGAEGVRARDTELFSEGFAYPPSPGAEGVKVSFLCRDASLEATEPRLLRDGWELPFPTFCGGIAADDDEASLRAALECLWRREIEAREDRLLGRSCASSWVLGWWCSSFSD